MRPLPLLLIAIATTFCATTAHCASRWQLRPNGSIVWQTPHNATSHSDHIEMSGTDVSVVVTYGIDDNRQLTFGRNVVWPMLRTIPNDTHASLIHHYDWKATDSITANGIGLNDLQVDSFAIHGALHVWSKSEKTGIKCHMLTFPATINAAVIDLFTLTNTSGKPVEINIPAQRQVFRTPAKAGVYGAYTLVAKVDAPRQTTLQPGESLSFGSSIEGFATAKGEQEQQYDATSELLKRMNMVDEIEHNLVLTTPNDTINRMFAFAKLRATESIYMTKCGPLHGPGGLRYYAAIWANDQAEYANPFFPFLGNALGNWSALTSFKLFARYINPDYKPIPSSIIAEGTDIWNGAGDRGDAAMIAYGASRYVLARASADEARQLWPLIEWCLEYCRRQLNADGVVRSDHDELEGRFPAGKANLCTSTLYYDALLSAAYLAKQLNKPDAVAVGYRKQAATLRTNIEAYFGADMKGFHTYRYYDGNELLRSWICMPLVVGIDDRKQGTIGALFDSGLWTKNGLLSQEGTSTFWDRATLYALRGVYTAGEPDRATEFLKRYSTERLLGDHVPYAVEAWPEGGQRHLSAESGLYARIFTEGLFGIRPTGFKSFTLTPQMPREWDNMSLSHLRICNSNINIAVRRQGKKLHIEVSANGHTQQWDIKNGTSINVVI